LTVLASTKRRTPVRAAARASRCEPLREIGVRPAELGFGIARRFTHHVRAPGEVDDRIGAVHERVERIVVGLQQVARRLEVAREAAPHRPHDAHDRPSAIAEVAAQRLADEARCARDDGEARRRDGQNQRQPCLR
jgi:hypothetical protein